MAEALQQLILDTLQATDVISDTRSLTLPGQSQPAASHEDQITILGALNSLASRDVRFILYRGMFAHPGNKDGHL
jgi:phenylalanyl-tRNA synthetase alpha chain